MNIFEEADRIGRENRTGQINIFEDAARMEPDTDVFGDAALEVDWNGPINIFEDAARMEPDAGIFAEAAREADRHEPPLEMMYESNHPIPHRAIFDEAHAIERKGINLVTRRNPLPRLAEPAAHRNAAKPDTDNTDGYQILGFLLGTAIRAGIFLAVIGLTAALTAVAAIVLAMAIGIALARNLANRGGPPPSRKRGIGITGQTLASIILLVWRPYRRLTR